MRVEYPDKAKPDWNTFVARHPCGHLLQTASWATLKTRFGWENQLVTLYDGEGLTAGAQVLYRYLPGRLLGIAYAPKGPLVDWENPDQARAILKRITAEARKRRAIFLRIEPDLMEGGCYRSTTDYTDERGKKSVESAQSVAGLLAGAGFRPSSNAIPPRRTLLVDISGSEDEILGRMKQKTRYNIRLAGRKGVVVREGGRKDLPIFNQLMAATAERNEFGVHSPEYYEAAYDLFAPGGELGLLITEFEGRPLAALMVFCLGRTAWYFYGASNNEERNRMPTYLLQWEAMRWARNQGCVQYDLWGVPDEDEETLEAEFSGRSDGLWGVYRFKRGFGGRLVRWVGAYDRVFCRPLYWIFGKLGNWGLGN